MSLTCKRSPVIVQILRWLRELNALQLQKTHSNRKITNKSRKHFHQFDSRWCKCSQHKQINVICSASLFLLCCEHLQRVCCQIGESVFLICRCFFYLQRVSFFGCVVSICSVCVVKLRKSFFFICRCFFYLQRVSFFGCIVSICSVCVVKLRKSFF